MSEQTNQPGEPASDPRRGGRRRRRMLIGGGVAVAVLAGAVGIGRAVEEHHHGMWRGHGVPVEFIEHRADWLLKRVEATPEQQTRVHAIIEEAAQELEPLRAGLQNTRTQFADLLSAPQVDRAAVEHLRTERLAEMDQFTQRVSKAAEDAAEVLTPDQRAKFKQIMADHEKSDDD